MLKTKKMKQFLLAISWISCHLVLAQDLVITPDNSWLKAGIHVGVPISDTADLSSMAAGVDFRGQYLVNPNFAIGVASGYSHFFGKDTVDDFGLIPLAGFVRYYFKVEGLFLGTDFGYGFLTNTPSNSGGLYLNPQIGYHNRKWNVYGFYQHTFTQQNLDLRVVGLGTTYNIRF